MGLIFNNEVKDNKVITKEVITKEIEDNEERDNEERDNEELIKEYHKRFADGEQYIRLGVNCIYEVEKSYYWEERLVFNHIKPLLSTRYFPESWLYGKDGFVSELIPYQILYNKLKNRKIENLCTLPTLLVEDGSVDIDNLESEGLAPGKILVYRNGATLPTFLKNDINVIEINKAITIEEESLLAQMYNIQLKWERKYDERQRNY